MFLHLQATDARMVFPCWDEPSLKATFDLTLIVPKELVALSNTVMLFSFSIETSLAVGTFIN